MNCDLGINLSLENLILNQAEHDGLFGRFLAIADRQSLVDPHGLVADGRNGKAHFGG